MTFQAKTASDLVSAVCVRLVEKHPYLCASSVSVNSSLCHFDMEDSRPYGTDES
jgi:hypothetical protein